MKRSICIIKDFANQLSLDLLCLNKITNEWELVNKYHHSLSANEKSDLANVIKTDLAEIDFQKSKLTVLIDGDYLCMTILAVTSILRASVLPDLPARLLSQSTLLIC